jgi:hypothetical protein
MLPSGRATTFVAFGKYFSVWSGKETMTPSGTSSAFFGDGKTATQTAVKGRPIPSRQEEISGGPRSEIRYSIAAWDVAVKLFRMHSPQFDQCSLIFPVVYLQAHAISLFHDCSNNRVNEAACVKRDGYAVTDLELPWGWVLFRHGGIVRRVRWCRTPARIKYGKSAWYDSQKAHQ